MGNRLFNKGNIKKIKYILFMFIIGILATSNTYAENITRNTQEDNLINQTERINITYTENFNTAKSKFTLTKQTPYNISIIKKKLYKNYVATNEIYKFLFKRFGNNVTDFLDIIKSEDGSIKKIKTKPIVSLLNGFLYVESGINNFGGRYNIDDYYNIISDSMFDFINNNAFNYNIPLYKKIEELQLQNYNLYKKYGQNIFYCNIGRGINNNSDIIYLINGIDYSESFQKRNEGKRTKIGHKISLCKVINNHLINKNYRRNLYYFINGKTSGAGAVLIFQFMPNNLSYYLDKFNKDNSVNLGDISFYYKMISLFLFGDDYINQIKYYNKHFNDSDKIYSCYKKLKYDKYCNYIRSQIFRYNHSNIYVQKILFTSYKLQKIEDIGLFSSPVNNIYFNIENIIEKIKKIPAYITQKYKGLKHWGIDITAYNNNYFLIDNKNYYITDRDNIELIYNTYEDMKCYFIPYNKQKILSKDIGNVVFCNNDRYGILYGHIKDLSKNLKIKKNTEMPNELVNKFVFQLTGKRKEYDNIPITYYEIENIKPGEVIAYMGNNGLRSFGLHTHYTIVDFKTHKFIKNNFIYDIIENIKYYK